MRFVQQVKRQLNVWAVLSFLFILFILLPNFLIGTHFFTTPNENWNHIKDYLLKEIVMNTLFLMSFTGFFTTIIGTSLAWIVTAYQFPFRKFFRWGLILPLAIPPFIGAYTYHGILNYTGIIQATLRNQFDIKVNQDYFNIMTIPGAIFIFTMFLFPYIFVITKSFFQNQSSSIVENARLLGGGPFEIFFRVILPISRAAIVGGVTIVMLEVINDYGVVKYYGIQTFITSIFQTWFAMDDLDSAFKLAGTLMIVVIAVLILEKFIRGRKRFSYTTTKIRPIQPKEVQGPKAWLLTFYCLSIFTFAFAIPFIQLIHWIYMTYERIVSMKFIELVRNSFFAGSISAVMVVVIGLIIANYTRIHKGIVPKLFSKITVLGYSVPGAIIAIGIITIFIALDQWIISLFAFFGKNPFIVFRTSIVMLISAYVIRFLTVGYSSIEAGFEKIGTNFTEASRTLGVSTVKTFFRIDIVMVRGAVVGGFILVFVDILKELPLTLLLQPFNFHTLATKAFQYANDEMMSEAASASMMIILISGISIYFFHKVLDKEGQN
ncbi:MULTISPECIES: ABC transporter permease [Bacillaceae]|uniref:ABC transporter permease n=1 Tax=Bacillaceae TaxID=186817 RepID=UPI000BFE1247|nr:MULTISPECIES: iron ABC transporter permease [Bacillaceae]PGT84129.1 iron ABC transporter [Bacillus sp. AFS040349]UGB33565.1 iron ABC transporter permease [Metabacillus sp. B2-18]